MGEDWLSESLGKIFRKMGGSLERAKKEFRDGYKDSLVDKENTSQKIGKKEPFVDVFKKGNRVRVLVEAPGAFKDDVHLGVYNKNILHVYIPSKYEDYSVDVKLPAKVKNKKARYKYNNGVMAISLETMD
ncbi:hypothetical protein [Methanonatronarchaeum sp. AMET-Sl]|uniref:Hsp20/alpha crystallin family protein n=1 Tax=Methanonatronarchaeum sp. AMET-Sl TaxID=3037654 RepID=UPI00244E33FE|nr:hypothetical protein [Methanonatronarchaeum sp. AMET-Sl]WGI17488.1 hypothetical protein QEN48_00340 [Methanonatronarchaeum sp. AMET-Sl]